jgi:hypothetical protein
VSKDNEITDSQRLIFIGGSPRSGTTLVQNMLDSHPLILGGPEFLHLIDMIDLRRKLHGSINREWISIICSREDVDRKIMNWIKDLFLPVADKNGSQFYSEKTPENIIVFSELLELFPEAHFIQILRDPRAILSSMLQVKERALAKGLNPPSFTATSSKSMAYIDRCFSAGAKACKQVPEKVLTIVYEQVVGNPERESKRICTHLGIEWDECMLRPGDKEHMGAKAITTHSNELWYDAKTYNRNIVTHDSEKWRKQLPLYLQIRATMKFADNRQLKEHGYDFSVKNIAHEHRFLLKVLIYSLSVGLFLYNGIHGMARKIPGYSVIKNSILKVARLLKLKR